MARFQTTFPFTFNNAPGDTPGSNLDDDFNAVNDGTLTIRAQELSDGNDYNVEQDDEYSFFVCKGVVDFQIIPPVAPPTGFGFFFSNETRQEAVEIEVTLCCTVFVGSVQYVNPVLVGDFLPNFGNVKGGLVQFDGNDYFFYPLFFASGGGATIQQGSVSVVEGDTGVTITHGFNQAGLNLTLLPQWNTQIWEDVAARTDTTSTFVFSNPVPAVSASPPVLELTYLVIFP
jgi:hypothetical protein